MNQEIENLRRSIDEINDNILDLLSERNKICKKIGGIKKEDGLAIRDEEREQEILSKLKEKAREKGLDEDYIENLFKIIIGNSREVQEN